MKRVRKHYVKLLILLLMLLTVAACHLYVADRLVFLKLSYPLEAFTARQKVQCSANSPPWLAEGIKKSSTFSLAGQTVYIEPNGKLHHCEMGWQGTPFITKKVTAKTYFRLASLTKVITSLAYLKLQDAGKLSNDDKLLDYIPEKNPLADPRITMIRLEDLLHHTAGFDRLITPDPMFTFKTRSWCPNDLLKLYEITLDFTPGERASYSNLGYCLIGHIIAKISEADFLSSINNLLDLMNYDLEYTNGPYSPNEVKYDFRNTGFFGSNHYQYFNYTDNWATTSLIGSATSYARLVYDNKDQLLSLLPLKLYNLDCPTNKFGACFHYSMEPIKLEHGPLVLTHSGNTWGATAFMMIDEHGGVFTWTGKGSPHENTNEFDDLKWSFYHKLSNHYTHQKIK